MTVSARGQSAGIKAAVLFMAVAGAVVLALGATAAALGIRDLLAGGAGAPQLLVLGVTGIVPGAFLLLAARKWLLHLAGQDRMRAANPDKPWLWDEEWSTGRVLANQTASPMIWLVAAGATLWSTSEIAGLRAGLDESGYRALASLLVPAFTTGLWVWLIRSAAGHRKFGRCELRLVTNPGAVGGMFAGEVRARFAELPESLRLSLLCVSIAWRGDDSPDEDELYRDDVVVQRAALRNEAREVVAPFAFAVPQDAPSTDLVGAPQIHWRLHAAAAVKGVDFSATFSVPIFGRESP
jgi:hypothetical protein